MVLFSYRHSLYFNDNHVLHDGPICLRWGTEWDGIWSGVERMDGFAFDY